MMSRALAWPPESRGDFYGEQGEFLQEDGLKPPTLLSVIFFLSTSLALMVMIWLLTEGNPRVAGIIYAILFTVLAWWRFHLAMALSFALVPFQQDLGGLPIKMAIADVNLVLLVPTLLLRIGRFPLAPSLIVPPSLYLTFCLCVTLDRLDSIAVKSLLQMFLYLIFAVGVFAQSKRHPSQLYWCFDSLIIVCTFFALIGIATGFTFLQIHKNGWGASISLSLVVAFEMWQSTADPSRRRWLLMSVGVLTVALVMTVSRGGWMAAMVGTMVLLTLRREWQSIKRLMIIVAPLALAGWFLLPENTQEYAMGFERSRGNIQARFNSVEHSLELWRESPWFGVGVGLRKEYDATNLVMLLLAETGIIGLVLFALIHANLARQIWTAHFWVPTQSVAFSCVSLGAALVAARLAHGMVDHYWSRGAILAAWAAAGMAVSVISSSGDESDESYS